MRKYTQKELREYIRLKLARDLTTVDPEELPRHGIRGRCGPFF